MDDVAGWLARDRADLFEDAAGRKGLNALLIEKDFWVCWILRRAYEATNRRLLFKGGTSLSKVHHAIRRFSEDVDLSFDRREFGFTATRDPATHGLSGKRRQQLLDEMKSAGREFVQGDFKTALAGRIEKTAPVEKARLSRYDPDPDGQSLLFEYPGALQPADYAGAYVRPAVILELGMRSQLEDGEAQEVEPYAAETHGSVFRDPRVAVFAQPLRRTFWEKATALHEKAIIGFRDRDPARFSRHYADVVALASGIASEALLADTDMLTDVADHKSVFFRVGGAPYKTARPGTLRLSPQGVDARVLRSDYAAMAEMFFDAPMPFDELLARLSDIENRINRR